MSHSSRNLCHIIELKEFPPAQEHFEWNLRWTACSECHLMAKPCFLLTQLPSKCNRTGRCMFSPLRKRLFCSERGIFGVAFLPTTVSLIKETGLLWILFSVGIFGGHTVVLRGLSGSGNDLKWGDTAPSGGDKPGPSSTALGYSHVGSSQLQASENQRPMGFDKHLKIHILWIK